MNRRDFFKAACALLGAPMLPKAPVSAAEAKVSVVFFYSGQYLDFSMLANRLKFILTGEIGRIESFRFVQAA